MNTIKLKYTGATPYRDRTVLRTLWQPGDVLMIPTMAARQLLKFREFEIAPDKARANPESEQVLQAFEAKEQEQEQQIESILLDVQGWDKGQLEAYARLYSVELDKRRSLANLRSDVATLVQTLGVR